ncbi:hypothetical protein [Pseudomonas costantinii]|uniref:hypothetical protein n=1 Tax=Pseudomonas costantinii TaxID=168469 RepID=UPI0015A39942|nr:hypothetical protein [Pseudomonas costantinii]NVZ72467.1 hypothetical protein [Pseudomonas costantinii]
MMIGTTFHTYSLDHAIETTQAATKPAEKPSTTDSNQPAQNTQSQANKSSLDSLGQGRLT